jgi:hypothetical protein
MAVNAVIRVLAGAIKIVDARTSGGETKLIHSTTSGAPAAKTVDRSGRVTEE